MEAVDGDVCSGPPCSDSPNSGGGPVRARREASISSLEGFLPALGSAETVDSARGPSAGTSGFDSGFV